MGVVDVIKIALKKARKDPQVKQDDQKDIPTETWWTPPSKQTSKRNGIDHRLDPASGK